MKRKIESSMRAPLRGSAAGEWGRIPLRAGVLSLALREGGLRNIVAGEREILRRVYVAVRDRFWNTVPHEISSAKVIPGRGSFSAQFECRHRRGDIDFAWHASIDGAADGFLSFSMEGIARSSFAANRIGLCVLLPLDEYMGRRCGIERVDGTRVAGKFPGRLIAPHQPFTGIRALFLRPAAGMSAEIRFEGDAFEMEDQRNWTDASFKVYCPPLTDAIPVHVKKGDRFSQKIRIKVLTDGMAPGGRRSRTGASWFSRQSFAIPEIGVGLGDAASSLTAREAGLVRACGFSHVRAELRCDGRDIPRAVRAAALKAEALGLPLEAAIFLRGDKRSIAEGAATLSKALRGNDARVKRCLVFRIAERVTSRETMDAFGVGAPRLRGQADIVSGTDGYFVEINRNRPPLRGARGVCYSVNPQVHTFDDEAVLDNIEGQLHVLRSARSLFPDKNIAVSPVTLRPRLNPLAPKKDHGPDPRQKTLLGAVWTLGSIIRSARGGASCVTYYETSGDCGIMARGGRSVFPMYHVFADVGEFAGGRLRPLEAPPGYGIDGCALEKGSRASYLIANLTPVPRVAVLEGMPRTLAVRRLDDESLGFARTLPREFRLQRGTAVNAKAGMLRIRLSPYAIVRLDEV